MPIRHKRFVALQAYLDERLAKGEELPEVFISLSLNEWLKKNAEKYGAKYSVFYNTIDMILPGVGGILRLKPTPEIGSKYPKELYLLRNSGSIYPDEYSWTIRKTGPHEYEFGFDSFDSQKIVDGFAVIHWMTDPDRLPDIDIISLNAFETFFKIKTDALKMEFKLNFDFG